PAHVRSVAGLGRLPAPHDAKVESRRERLRLSRLPPRRVPERAARHPVRGRAVHGDAELPKGLPAEPAEHEVHLAHVPPERVPERRGVHLDPAPARRRPQPLREQLGEVEPRPERRKDPALGAEHDRRAQRRERRKHRREQDVARGPQAVRPHRRQHRQAVARAL
ncbi:hypothetical protein IWQ56_006503, partial [Coemansia nantahalensis]